MQINKKPGGQDVICLRGVAGSAVVAQDATNVHIIVSANALAAFLRHFSG